MPQPALVNCTGLGARALFSDEALSGWKGQTTLLLPQPEVDYVLDFEAVEMVPRKDGVVFGCCSWWNVESQEPDIEAARQSLARALDFFTEMS